MLLNFSQQNHSSEDLIYCFNAPSCLFFFAVENEEIMSSFAVLGEKKHTDKQKQQQKQASWQFSCNQVTSLKN